MDQTDASPQLRYIFAGMGASMLVLWGSTLSAAIQNWGNPNEDGMSYVPVFWVTLTCLPVGLYLFAGAIVARGRPLQRAHRALLLACVLLALVIAFLVFQYISNSMDAG
ncbi:MAG: hypothetical protein WBQ24_09820 [Xanthobacteraceae bacterium]